MNRNRTVSIKIPVVIYIVCPIANSRSQVARLTINDSMQRNAFPYIKILDCIRLHFHKVISALAKEESDSRERNSVFIFRNGDTETHECSIHDHCCLSWQ